MTASSIGPLIASAACLAVHCLLLGSSAPFATALEDMGAAFASGRRPPPLLLVPQRLRHGIAAIPSALAHPAPSASPPLAEAAALAAVLSTALAALLVPSFATGLPFGHAGGLVLVLVLLAGARIGRLVASAAADAADIVEDTGRALVAIAFLLPAGIVVALLGATIGGSTRLDALAAAASLAPLAPRAALAASLLLLLLADRLLGRDRAVAALPIAATLLEAESALRFVVFLSLVALVLPPTTTVDATAGIPALALSIPVFLGKLAILAFLAGTLRPTLIGRAPSALIGVAAFLALLGAVLVVVGETVE